MESDGQLPKLIGNSKQRRKARKLLGHIGYKMPGSLEGPNSMQVSSQPSAPFYERNLFWGLISFGGAAVLMAAGALLPPTELARWLLVGSAIVFSVPIWLGVREIPWKRGRWVVGGVIWFLVATAEIRIWSLHTGLSLRPAKVADVPYNPPKGPGIRVDIKMPIASSEMCKGMSESAELECLCPRPLPYTLRALPPPQDNNYSTEVNIKAAREPMYRVRLFARSEIFSGKIDAAPYGEGKAAVGVMEMDYDRHSLLINSSAPEREFKLEVRSSQALRLKCIDQIN